jgi:predicted XRE-type DNA-binding protein
MDNRSLEERLMCRVKEENGCWNWQGTLLKSGLPYGSISFRAKAWLVHRLSWTHFNGQDIPEGKLVLHTCDNPRCINPEHLYIGTHSENQLDTSRRNRRQNQDGDSNPNFKLKTNQIDEIRELLDSGTMKQKDIAAMYDVSQSHISLIKNRKLRINV